MYTHPHITYQLAADRHRDLIHSAELYRQRKAARLVASTEFSPTTRVRRVSRFAQFLRRPIPTPGRGAS